MQGTDGPRNGAVAGFRNCENLRPPTASGLTINQLKFVMRGTQMVLLYENMCRAGMACKYPSVKHIPYIPRVPSASVASPRSLRPFSPPPFHPPTGRPRRHAVLRSL